MRFWKRQRDRISEWGFLRTAGYYLFAVLPDKLGIKLLSSFEHSGVLLPLPACPSVTFSILTSTADWTARDLELLQKFQDVSIAWLFPNFFARGDSCVVARWEGLELACVCWLEQTEEYAFAPGKPCILIHNCFTFPAHRGKGLYPQTLSFARQYLQSARPEISRIFIDCSIANYASKRGIQKAGFSPVGTVFNAFKQSWVWPRSHCSAPCEEKLMLLIRDNPVCAETALAGYEIELIRSIEALHATDAGWREFLSSDVQGANFFNDPAHVELSLRHGPNLAPWIVVLRRAGKIRCIAPFYVHNTDIKLQFSVLTLASMRVNMLKLLGGQIVTAFGEDRQSCFREVTRAVWEHRDQFDLICIENLDVTSDLWDFCHSTALHVSRFQSFLASSNIDTVHQIRFPPTHDEYLKSISYETRRKLRRFTRRLREQEHVRLERITSPEMVPEFLDQVDTVYRDCWQAQLNGYRPRNTVPDCTYLAGLAQHGWFRSYVLLNDDGPIAFALGFQYRGTFYYQETGYTQKFAHYGPGTVLLHLFLEDLFNYDPPELVDFLVGDFAYKRSFANRQHGAASIYLSPPNRWRLILQFQSLLHFGSRIVVRTLVALRIDRAMRKLVGRRT